MALANTTVKEKDTRLDAFNLIFSLLPFHIVAASGGGKLEVATAYLARKIHKLLNLYSCHISENCVITCVYIYGLLYKFILAELKIPRSYQRP